MSDLGRNLPEGQQSAGKVIPALRDLLSVFDIVTSNRYMTLANQDEINIYVIYMTYRVQQDLYQVCQESGLLCGLSWDNFVLLMRGHRPARAAAMVVVRETLKEFYRCGHYDFDVTDVKFLRDTDAEGGGSEILHCSSLFTSEEGRGLIENFLFHAEASQYRHLLDQGKSLTWQEYLDELERKGPTWNQVYAAFQGALARLDFKPAWKSERLEGLVNQADRPEVQPNG